VFGGLLELLLLASSTSFLFLQLRRRVHAATALFAAAVARRLIVTVIEPVVVDEFLACFDVTNGGDVHATADLVGLAVRLAGVVHEHRHAVSVNDDFALADAEQVGEGPSLVAQVAFIFGDALTLVFQQARAFRHRFQGKAAGGMDIGTADDQAGENGKSPKFRSITQSLEAAFGCDAASRER
jgi:hypothetical protein